MAPPEQNKDQRLVETQFGKGLVVFTRPDGTQEVELLEWKKSVKETRVAAKQYGTSKGPHMIYTKDALDSVDPKVGDDVICSFGRGTVTKIVRVKIVKKETSSSSDETAPDDPAEQHSHVRQLFKYEVELNSWRLAGRSKVKCYLYKQAIQVVRKKMISEMSAQERVEFSQRQKASAVKVFKEKQYQQALNLYAGAVDAVRYVQHDASSSNETRADLVEVMVTCSNNAATCCAQLKRWPEAIKYAQNALVLLDALNGKKGMNIHTILTSDTKAGGCGLCDAKLFGEWRVKSYILIARGQAEKKDYAGAIEILRRAREIMLEYMKTDKAKDGGTSDGDSDEADDRTMASVAHLKIQDKEIRRLMNSCTEGKKAEKKKEKQRAQAMFGSPATRKTAGCGKNDHGASDEEKKEGSSPPQSPLMRGGIVKSNGEISTTGNGKGGSGPSVEEPFATPTKEIRPKIVRNMPRQSSLKKNRPQPLTKRSVSFSTEVSERRIESDFDGDVDDEEEGEAFLEQNKEALILVGIAGLAALSIIALRGRR